MINKEELKRIIDVQDEGPSLDYKEDLVLEKDGDKAEFIKDIVSLANSSKLSHIVIGVEDKTRKLVGLNTTHTAEQLNDILKNKCDPPISLEYTEQNIYGHQIGVIEINGENPPFIISVTDKFGGKRTSGESCHVCRGMLFIRNNNKNEGAIRANIEKMYEDKIKYVTVQAELQLSHSMSIVSVKDHKEIDIEFILNNTGDVIAADPFMYVSFDNIEQIINCKQHWHDVTTLNKKPTIQYFSGIPAAGKMHIGGAKVQVTNETKQINTSIEIFSTNMKNKKLKYDIPLE